MHIGKQLEAHQVEKGRLSCDIDAPQVGSARSDSTRAVQVNRRKKEPSQNENPTVFNCIQNLKMKLADKSFENMANFE